MRLSWTLSRYLGVQFLIGIGIVFGACLAIIFLVDIVQLLQRASSREAIAFSTIAAMALYKLPNISEIALPFAVLFGAIWTFVRLSRSNELVVARASGVSVWQFLSPALFITLFGGLLVVTVYNPIAASMVSQYERLETRYLKGQSSSLTVSSSGLWLRQGDEFGQSVIHALQLSDQGRTLTDVTFLFYEGQDKFRARIDAKGAKLEDGYWDLKEAWLTIMSPTQETSFHERYSVDTPLTQNRIKESFASPQTMSFWELPRFIALAEAAGFSAKAHRLHWHTILATPFLLSAMILVAATFSLRVYRLGGLSQLAVAGIVSGFLLYFLSDVSAAFGMSGHLPVILAAWTPTLVAMLLGTAMLFHLEDG
jgi:lipopolysaccharide export system permease protein